jgi:hypothetical protein
MSGHTRFSSLVSLNVDGERIVATGDQYFFQDFDHPGAGPASHNHVYRNGAVIDSFRESHEALARLAPTIILPGHGTAYRVPDEFLTWTSAYGDEYERIHRSLMPISTHDVHFEVDSRAGWLEPYRKLVEHAGRLVYRAHVRNPYPEPALLELRMIVPDGWSGGQLRVHAGARSEIEVELEVNPPTGTVCRRTPVALELRCGDRSFGQIAEALITIGHDIF